MKKVTISGIGPILPLYLGNGNSYLKSKGILLKALSKGYSMKKIPSKSDINFKIYISYKNTVFGLFDPFFPKMAANTLNFFYISFLYSSKQIC